MIVVERSLVKLELLDGESVEESVALNASRVSDVLMDRVDVGSCDIETVPDGESDGV